MKKALIENIMVCNDCPYFFDRKDVCTYKDKNIPLKDFSPDSFEFKIPSWCELEDMNEVSL